jgi:hypothetical protein
MQQSRNLATQQSRNLATQSCNLAKQQHDFSAAWQMFGRPRIFFLQHNNHATLQRNNIATFQRNNHATLQRNNHAT